MIEAREARLLIEVREARLLIEVREARLLIEVREARLLIEVRETRRHLSVRTRDKEIDDGDDRDHDREKSDSGDDDVLVGLVLLIHCVSSTKKFVYVQPIDTWVLVNSHFFIWCLVE